MEKREKKARVESLSELRRLRTEGGSRLETLKEDEENEREGSALGRAGDTNDLEELYEYESFIESPERIATSKRPPIFTFKPRVKVAIDKDRPLDSSALKNDSYFQSIISQMDEEISEDGTDVDESSANVSSFIESQTEMLSETQLASEQGVSIANCPTSDPVMPFEFSPQNDFFQIDDRILDEQLDSIDWNSPKSASDQINPQPQSIEEPPVSQATVVDFFKDSLKCNFNQDVDNNVKMTPQTLPILEESSTRITEGQPIDFYWLDAFEKQNGTIFLFGKVAQGNAHVSCCVIINNMKRNLMFLPREYLLSDAGDETEHEVTLKDVHDEISAIAAEHHISRFGCKKVSRKYAFEIPDVPVEADYIKMVYPFDAPTLPKELRGKSFSHVFGVNSSALELFLLKRKIMGPCWLRFLPKSISKRNRSWCKLEIEVDDPKTVKPLINGPEPPLLTALSLSVRTIIEPESKTHEIVAASALLYNSVHADGNTSSEKPACHGVFSVVREAENLGFTAKFSESIGKIYGSGKIELAKTERALLSYLVTIIYRCDPDVIVGHNFLGFDLGVLLHRMRACKVDFWSRIGRLNWSQWPKAKPGTTEASYAERQITSGRLICDTYLCAKDLVKCKNYSLQTLVETQLQMERDELDYDRIRDYFTKAELVVQLVKHCEKDAFYCTSLMFQLLVLPLTKQLSNIAGNLWSRTLVGGRAERNEYLLLHEFHNNKFICPDKTLAYESKLLSAHEEQEGKDDGPQVGAKGRRKPTYAGGLVLEPKKGLYENIVLLLDFNSLYPSIIQEFNICFTTIERDYSTPEASEQMPSLPDTCLEQGVLPKILCNLVSRRRQIKSLMKDPKLSSGSIAQLHIRQQALKLTANSMYGCLGFGHSRFYAKPLAMLITAKGREILQNTVELAQSQCRLDVIYGDTDSVMIHTGTKDISEARKMAQLLKKTVNERYRLLEIELDGIFEKLLLLKKKKYAAIIIEEKSDGTIKRKTETKGLDLVRRDWCQLSVDTSNLVLEKILSAAGKDEVVDGIHQILRDAAAKVDTDEISLEKYIVNKNLTKEPEQYADAKSQPHVVVAIRMKQRGMVVKAGDTIPYVICGSLRKSGSLAEHAFHPEEVRKEHLIIDKEWYLSQQVHPCVSRLCEHLEGTDVGRLASCLGLDASKYHSRTGPGNQDEDDTITLTAFLNDEEKYQHAKKLILTCPTCNSSFEFLGLLTINDKAVSVGVDCACGQRISAINFYYQMLTSIRQSIDEYYLGWLECDEAGCRAQTRQMRVYDTRCVVETCRGSMKPKITAQRLYYQLLYYQSLVDLDRMKKMTSDTADMQFNSRAFLSEYELVQDLVRKYLSKSSYPIINLGEIFSFVSLQHT